MENFSKMKMENLKILPIQRLSYYNRNNNVKSVNILSLTYSYTCTYTFYHFLSLLINNVTKALCILSFYQIIFIYM